MDETRALALAALWWDEVWGDGRLDAVAEIYTDPFLRHGGTGTRWVTVAEYQAMIADFQRTLHRPRTTVDDRTIAGDRMWTRATSRGVHLDSGDPTVVTWLLVQRVDGDRVAEQWALVARDVDWTRPPA